MENAWAYEMQVNNDGRKLYHLRHIRDLLSSTFRRPMFVPACRVSVSCLGAIRVT
jgi:hypothetical protein